MSQRNVEIVRRTNEARNRQDVDAVVREVDPDLEFDWSESRAAAGGTIPEVLHGREQLRKQLSELLDAWESVTWELREVVEVSSDQVLEVSHVHFSGRDGIEFDDDGALLWTFRGGKAIRLKFFPSREKALEAVGLEDDESASSASRSARCCGRSTGRCCLRSTKAAWCSPTEGIDDIRAAFPDAAAMMADRPPSADKEFALALREFCEAI